MPEWIFLIFVAIREEEQKSSDVTKEIQKLVKENPAINANEIAEMLSVKAEEVRYRIKLMKKLGEIMVEKFDNEIPKDLETLITLPGVGRKTANVYLSTVYDLPNIAVDTHVRRVANRLQLVHSQDPQKIEFELYKLFPQRYHNKVSSWLIDFGRNICKARGSLCGGCPFKNFCIKGKKLS